MRIQLKNWKKPACRSHFYRQNHCINIQWGVLFQVIDLMVLVSVLAFAVLIAYYPSLFTNAILRIEASI